MKKHLESNFLDEILPCEHFEMKAFELNFYVAWFPVQEIFPSRNILNWLEYLENFSFLIVGERGSFVGLLKC